VVEVEFKFDERDQRYKLLDVNARFWTWSALGARAGVDFAYLAWQLASGKRILPCRARPGVAWMHGSRDIMAAYREWSAGNLTIRRYIDGFRQPMVFANAAFDDPMPAICEMPLLAWNFFMTRWVRKRQNDCSGRAADEALW
jgi:D-aspartate ligase